MSKLSRVKNDKTEWQINSSILPNNKTLFLAAYPLHVQELQ